MERTTAFPPEKLECPPRVLVALERVRTDAADTMHHSTTDSLDARLMSRVGARELALVLAWLDQHITATDTGRDT